MDATQNEMIEKMDFQVESATGDPLFHVELRNCIVERGSGALVYPGEAAFNCTIFHALAWYPGTLTGNHLRFIREQMGINRYQMSVRLDTVPSRIAEFEDRMDRPAKCSYLEHFAYRMESYFLWETYGPVASTQQFRELWNVMDSIGRLRPGTWRIVFDIKEGKYSYDSEEGSIDRENEERRIEKERENHGES